MNENEASSLIKEIENKQNIINELTEKFTNIEDKLKQLEEEKINLFYRINEADRINEFTVGNYNNVIYHHQKQITDNKNLGIINYEHTFQMQKEKIQQLEKIVEFQINSEKGEIITFDVNHNHVQINNSSEFFKQLVCLSEKNEELKTILEKFSEKSNHYSNLDKEREKISKNIVELGIGDEKKEDDKEQPLKIKDFQKDKKQFENEKNYILKTLEEKAEKVFFV